MIKKRQNKIERVRNIITTRISGINTNYRGGPSLHFYHRVIQLRQQKPSVLDFIGSDPCVEMLYATLVSWDMNSRGAKMKDYSDFKKNIQQNRDLFTETEKALELFSWSQNKDIIPYLKELYNSLILMETNSKLISNSKCLHFIFPKACLPIDGTNTLNKLYGNTGESRNKFIEVHQFAWDILTEIANPKQYLDNQWNRSETKLVDNAIILLDMQ